MKKNPFFSVIYFIFLAFVVLFAISYLHQLNSNASYTYAQIRGLLENQKVESVVVTNDSVKLYLKEPTKNASYITYPLYSFDLFYKDFNNLIVDQWETGVLSDYDYPHSPTPSWVSTVVPVLIILGAIALIWYFVNLRQSRSGNSGRATQFGRARTRSLADTGKPVTFKDVAGADEEKAELAEIVEFLRDPKRFLALGARIPKGVLLVGPPGTGKTLIARAVAGEAGVQFLSISGSDFVELYVGVGASRVRDLFEQAKKGAPAIVFIDEIDAVGRQRGTGLGGGHDEREQTLNQLLVEMDGFASNEGVIVLAATNRADILDPALLRPGRFDRQIYVGLPDMKGREEVLKVHAKNKPLAEDVDLSTVARATSGFTGADLENLMNEAALLSAREKKSFITMECLHEAMLKVIAGPEKKSRVIPPLARRLTAYHEAGHAIVIHALESQDPVHQITIIPRGPSGGMTISLPREDRPYQSRRELTERITVCLGGRVAEQLILGDSSTGASNDLQTATSIARSMVTRYGMSDKLGTVAFDNESQVFIGRSMSQTRSYSEEVAGLIDEEIRAIIDGCYVQCESILKDSLPQLELTARYLLEYETMTAEQFDLVFTNPDALNLGDEADTEEDEPLAQLSGE